MYHIYYIGKSDKEFSSDTIPSKMMRMAQSSSDETLSGKYMSYGYNYTEKCRFINRVYR